MVKLEPEALEGTAAVQIQKWSWADDGKSAKVYIDAEQEPRPLAAAASGKIEVDFQEKSFQLRIIDGTQKFQLAVPYLYMPIVPEKSSFRLGGEGKRITVSLRKVESEHTWFMLQDLTKAKKAS
eukprot:gnl/TRDRNA2_/TRDRNA2_93133_c1_seq1.p1 gnl/TRDRNA2_/TRDRNA2_93133_c1~~gnl/TRDRNA2_/TRDRNA2_93133_c1_seq1.p1  ORF type:complete len:135 (-),score=38.12 gnl/TRDRNA2_/TRDRNA2_93133_c1_seq1:154-525(-)